MKTILYLTDLYYEANSRVYYEEDLAVTAALRHHFNILIGHPQQALAYLTCADLVVFRNTGPVIYYRDYFDRFVKAVNEQGVVTFNSFDGKADLLGKEYLLQLTEEGFPVIPTIAKLHDLHRLGEQDTYMVKLLNGADSIGMQTLTKAQLSQTDLAGKIIQPFLDFTYEVSFYFLNNVFQYALYAPDKSKRWDLKVYETTASDLQFAQAFIAWDNVAQGIVRVDACRLADGSLLLVELEDLNPFLSLAWLPPLQQTRFIANLVTALEAAVNQ